MRYAIQYGLIDPPTARVAAPAAWSQTPLGAAYCRAIALRGEASRAWEAVEECRRRHREIDSAARHADGEAERALPGYYDPGYDRDAWWPLYTASVARAAARKEAASAEEFSALEAFHSAQSAERESVAAIESAISGADWGAQPGGFFVARQRALGSGTTTTTLHAPHRRGALAVCIDGRLDALSSPAEAWARYAPERARLRAERRAAHEVYLRDLAAAAAHLCAGLSLEWYGGQHGGIVRWSERLLSAVGVLYRAGVTPRTAAREWLCIKADDRVLRLSDFSGAARAVARQGGAS